MELYVCLEELKQILSIYYFRINVTLDNITRIVLEEQLHAYRTTMIFFS